MRSIKQKGIDTNRKKHNLEMVYNLELSIVSLLKEKCTYYSISFHASMTDYRVYSSKMYGKDQQITV